jgi:hypothetical protein
MEPSADDVLGDGTADISPDIAVGTDTPSGDEPEPVVATAEEPAES